MGRDTFGVVVLRPWLVVWLSVVLWVRLIIFSRKVAGDGGRRRAGIARGSIFLLAPADGRAGRFSREMAGHRGRRRDVLACVLLYPMKSGTSQPADADVGATRWLIVQLGPVVRLQSLCPEGESSRALAGDRGSSRVVAGWLQ
jgi:hypothetical protein